MWHHPKYYKELRKRNKAARIPPTSSGQAASDQVISKEPATAGNQRALGPGLKPQASSSKPRLVIRSAWKLQAPSSKPQASSPVAQGSSFKPQASSSWIMDPGKSFTDLWPRCSTKIKVFFGCFTWNAIWWGENLTLLLFVTFSSTVKKWPEVLQPNRSGVPERLRFSSLIHEICGTDFLSFSYNFRSGFKVTRAF